MKNVLKIAAVGLCTFTTFAWPVSASESTTTSQIKSDIQIEESQTNWDVPLADSVTHSSHETGQKFICSFSFPALDSIASEETPSPLLNLGFKWEDTPRTVEFYCSFTGSSRNAVQNAMNKWNAVKDIYGENMVTMELSNDSSLDCAVEYAYLSAKNVGYCDMDILGTTILGARVQLNYAYNYSVGGSASSFDIQTIVQHELGHALGIAHCHEGDSECFSPTCSQNVMNPNSNPLTIRHTLQDYDIASYRYIYNYMD